MFAKKLVLKELVLLSCLFLLSSSTAFSQDFCEGDFDYDGDVDGIDALGFKADFGRMQYSYPCPPDGPAPVEKTGQTTCYDALYNTIDCTGTGQDGEYQKGVEWPVPRFTDNGNGTITDNLTGLMWAKNAQQISGTKTCSEAITACNNLNYAYYTDWRLPNLRELNSLIHYGFSNPTLPNTAGTGKWTEGDPFSNVPSDYYWSSTTSISYDSHAWIVNIVHGYMIIDDKPSEHYVWPVRGGH